MGLRTLSCPCAHELQRMISRGVGREPVPHFRSARDVSGARVSLGSKCEKLAVSITSPLVPLIADIEADIVFRRFVPHPDMWSIISSLSVAWQLRARSR